MKMAKPLEGIVLSEPIRLEQYDPDGDSYVIFQRPARWEAEKIAELYSQTPIQYEDAGRKITQMNTTPWAVVDREQVKMCLVECNIPTEDGKLVFKPGASCRAPKGAISDRIEVRFYAAWFSLPDDLAEEIAEKLRKWHPPFARGQEAEEGED